MPQSRRLIVGEADGSPRSAVTEIQFSNSSTTISGSVASVTTGGVSGTIVGFGIGVSSGTAAMGTGVLGDREIPYACTIGTARIFADVSGTATVTFWKDTYANFPPTSGDVVGTVTLASQSKNENTGLAVSVTAGDIIRYSLDTMGTAVITKLTVALTATRS